MQRINYFNYQIKIESKWDHRWFDDLIVTYGDYRKIDHKSFFFNKRSFSFAHTTNFPSSSSHLDVKCRNDRNAIKMF